MSTTTEEPQELELAKPGEPTKQSLIDEQLSPIRAQLRSELALCDAIATIALRLPTKAIPCIEVVSNTMMLYGCSRELSLMIISAVSAGRWAKNINASYPDTIDYQTIIDGVNIHIYGTEPPPSCRIVLEEIDVPAHKATKRTLVCSEQMIQASAQAL